MRDEPRLAGPAGGIDALPVEERYGVGPAGGGGKPQVEEVVLPEADGADVVRSRLLCEDKVAAAGARAIAY